MKEEFITFEQAKALKECKFDWECNHYYFHSADGSIYRNMQLTGEYRNYNNLSKAYSSAPTQAMAQKWLRDVHDLHICVDATIGEEEWQFILRRIHDSIESSGYGFDSYESALSAGIDVALVLMKRK